MTEKVVGSRRVFEGRLINVRVDSVALKSGVEAQREVVEHHGAVSVIPLVDPECVLLVRQYRHPVGESLLEVPAGTLRPGESPDECAARELIEETCFKAGKLDKLGFTWVAPGYSTEGVHFYVARDLSPEVGTPDEDEDLAVETYSWRGILQMISDGTIRDAKTVAALLMTRAWLSESSA